MLSMKSMSKYLTFVREKGYNIFAKEPKKIFRSVQKYGFFAEIPNGIDEMGDIMTKRQMLIEQIEKKRSQLNEMALKNLSSEECFQISVEIDRLLEQLLLLDENGE